MLVISRKNNHFPGGNRATLECQYGVFPQHGSFILRPFWRLTGESNTWQNPHRRRSGPRNRVDCELDFEKSFELCGGIGSRYAFCVAGRRRATKEGKHAEFPKDPHPLRGHFPISAASRPESRPSMRNNAEESSFLPNLEQNTDGHR